MKKTYLRDGRAPIPEKESISRAMSANKAKDTKPELALRKFLWKNGLRGYRLHWKKVPGRPDIVYSKKKIAIFVNGCFWHRCPNCNPSTPKTHQEFWLKKFCNNIERDKRKLKELKRLGWQVIVIWECQIKKNISLCTLRIQKKLSQDL